MAFVPDEAINRMREISAPAFQLYSYYCKKRSNLTGAYEIPNGLASAETGIDRCQVRRLKLALAEAKWIEVDGDTIRPIMGDFEPADRRTLARSERQRIYTSGDAPSPSPPPMESESGDAPSPKPSGTLRPIGDAPSHEGGTHSPQHGTLRPQIGDAQSQIGDAPSPHIRNTSPPALNQPPTSPAPARAPAPVHAREGGGGASKFPRETCIEYARSLSDVRSPQGFGKAIWRDASHDPDIEAWLTQKEHPKPAVEEKPAAKVAPCRHCAGTGYQLTIRQGREGMRPCVCLPGAQRSPYPLCEPDYYLNERGIWIESQQITKAV